ncbi:hypothetical protein [Posidoniimonas corsicana]|uniref:hypothetical protein n=1 Tax=Posidoniimonas corsicana TaxID=1938618 RepID=UPI0011B4F8D7|nr:hypothetical protein [Posidoniimonas corsicana]
MDSEKQNPYSSPSAEEYQSSEGNLLRGLVFVPLAAGGASAIIAVAVAIVALLTGVDNPAAIPLLIAGAIIVVPLIAGVCAIVFGIPIVIGLRKAGRLTPGWVMGAGVLFAVSIVAIAQWFITLTSTYDSNQVSLLDAYFGGLLPCMLVLGTPVLACFGTYAYWLYSVSRKAG